MVDPDGSLDRLETRLVAALKSLRKAEVGEPWEFNMDGCCYRIFIAGSEQAAPPVEGDIVAESFGGDALPPGSLPRSPSGGTRRAAAAAADPSDNTDC